MQISTKGNGNFIQVSGVILYKDTVSLLTGIFYADKRESPIVGAVCESPGRLGTEWPENKSSLGYKAV